MSVQRKLKSVRILLGVNYNLSRSSSAKNRRNNLMSTKGNWNSQYWQHQSIAKLNRLRKYSHLCRFKFHHRQEVPACRNPNWRSCYLRSILKIRRLCMPAILTNKLKFILRNKKMKAINNAWRNCSKKCTNSPLILPKVKNNVSGFSLSSTTWKTSMDITVTNKKITWNYNLKIINLKVILII